MTDIEQEVRHLEVQLAQLRISFEVAAAPILSRLAEIRAPTQNSDRQLLIPRQGQRHSPGTRLPRQF